VTVTVTFATVDLNIEKLEMVADHLTTGECRKLSESLHMHHFALDHPLSGSGEPNGSCLDLLIHWDRHEGYNSTFHILALRLGQINRRDLADKLSKAVYHEKSEAVKQSLLSDPFKENIHKNSAILEESPKEVEFEDDTFSEET